MSSSNEKTNHYLDQHSIDIKELIELLRKKNQALPSQSIISTELIASNNGQNERVQQIQEATGKKLDHLIQQKKFEDPSLLNGNIENYIGMTMVPTGVIGPVKILGTAAKGEFFVPLATSEGALVASYHRGAKACRLAGGITSVCLVEAVQRSPVFKFKNLADLGEFLFWANAQIDHYKKITSETSRYAKLNEVKTNIEGNHLILIFEFSTGDASGQNMVTICTDAICQYIVEHAPIKPEHWFIEGNYSGDKKATALSFTNVRGKKVTAEITIPEDIVQSVLKSTPKKMVQYWQSSTIGVIQSGSIGAQGHFANGLTALFIATGQDAACVAEAAVGITRMELTAENNLYCSVTLPNLIVGTVGGGTGLPTQRECLELMDCFGEGKARKFAEICAATVICGELSIAAALSAGHFSQAHKVFGRKKI